MASQNASRILEEILLLHKSMNRIAKQKSDAVIKGDIEALKSVLSKEKLHIKAIDQKNREMREISAALLSGGGDIVNDPTLSAVIAVSAGNEKMNLSRLKVELETEISELAHQNKLNQQLLEQSLDFIHLTMDLIQPDPNSYTYGHPQDSPQSVQRGQSIFDSKA
ncbi:flagellar protein FlgN [Bacillus sp. M6-12]|uniref:flagellar protein FlgN n=1 Tax=Bacillus sp. M6-12 TaxID=2054166 RepID=UPI000C762769|nr:flagellar protein FlgN [Bacillus sp. M6-12]PLS17868.1 flagellar protein FlgN [Bacillus sp. M6-12]